jgi:Uncharacterized conserved protein
MTLKERLQEDFKNAMREKNDIKKNTIVMIKAAILQIEKDTQTQLEDDKIIEIIAKEGKKRKEALPNYEKSGREDLIQQIKQEIEVVNEYLPKQLTEEDLIPIIQEAINEVGAVDIKDIGKVMQLAKSKVGVRADGRMINEIVKKLLQNNT